MEKIAKGVNKVNFTMLYGNYCYIIIVKFSQKFSLYTEHINFGSIYDFSKFHTLSHIKFTDFFYSVYL